MKTIALAQLYESIEREMELVRARFDDELCSELPFVNELCDRVARYRGKMLRPALLLLSGKAAGELNDSHITLAAVVEMVHMATLVHDDVLDEAQIRRKSSTINATEGNQSAVLLGDYLISHAYHLCSSLDSQEASRLIGRTTNIVCEGELMQIHHRDDPELTEERYLEIIERKTAALTETCCTLGAMFAGASNDIVSRLGRFGRKVGVAFQIIDDVLDLVGVEQVVGKTLGRDLDLGKSTLPIIHCLSVGNGDIVRRLRKVMANGNGSADPHADAGDMRLWLQETDSIDYACSKAAAFISDAQNAISVLPSSSARDTLLTMSDFVLSRRF